MRIACVCVHNVCLCVQIPNPLFDLAGITCGHFLIPFWTFFGATLIGKALIKMHLQQTFVIVAFSEHHVDMLLDATARVPLVGARIREPLARYLEDQRLKFHGKIVPVSNCSTPCTYARYYTSSLVRASARLRLATTDM